jgi:hypothetical protein
MIFINFEELDHPNKQHNDVDGVMKPYEKIKNISKDDDFPNMAIMNFNVEKNLENYLNIIQYFDGMNFLN